MDVFERLGLGRLIDSSLGKRDASWNAFRYSEVIETLFCNYLCGGDCLEDINMLAPQLALRPGTRIPNSDTVGRVLEGHLFGESGSIVWGKNVQTAYEGDFDPKACLMAGKLDDEGNIKFKNICSYIKFKTDFACTSIEITSTGNPLVSSRVLITLDKDGVPSVIQPDGLNAQYQTVTLAGPSGKAGNATLIPAGMLEEKTEFVQTYFANPDFQNFVNARVFQAAVSQLSGQY